MPYKSPELEVNPSVLEWARTTAGYSSQDVGERLGVSAETVEGWGISRRQVSLRATQLEDLAHFFRRPLAAFLLNAPPVEPAPPMDFRRVAGQPRPFSPSLRLAIRRTRRLQNIARELLENANLPTDSEIPTFTLDDVPELAGAELRKSVGTSIQEQLDWKSEWVALRHWRNILETRNILVFQSDFEREEAQGFSASDTNPYAIVLSSGDHPSARCFTLFHELGHLTLRQEGICVTEFARHGHRNMIAKTEDWCHRFAEAFLVDGKVLLSMSDTRSVIQMDDGYEYGLKRLASRFKVSRAVILFRLWHRDSISESSFWSMYTKLQEMHEPKPKKKKPEGGLPPAQKTLLERGGFFSRLVLGALDNDRLGYTEASDYLGIRPRHFDRLRMMVLG